MTDKNLSIENCEKCKKAKVFLCGPAKPSKKDQKIIDEWIIKCKKRAHKKHIIS